MAPVLFISSLRCKLDYSRMRVTRMAKSFFRMLKHPVKTFIGDMIKTTV